MDQDDSLFDKSKESYSQFTSYVQMNQQMFLSKMLECSIKSSWTESPTKPSLSLIDCDNREDDPKRIRHAADADVGDTL